MSGAGRPADALLHEGAAEVVDPCPQQLRGPAGPVFTQEAWMCSIAPAYAMRPTACTSTTSRQVGPRRAPRLRYTGAAMCTKGSGTNS